MGSSPRVDGQRQYNRRAGCPALDVDFSAVCDAVLGARNGSGETLSDVAARFGVIRAVDINGSTLL